MAETIIQQPLEKIMPSRFMPYAISVIADRALPDVKTGLKPIQTKILYDAYELKILSNTPRKKSARIVGDVLAKYSEHGDQSAYDALVLMCQEWKMRYPLIDMEGNQGSIDGDGAAAMRYTTCRLSR